MAVKRTAILFFSVCLLVSSSCKKSGQSNPSIVGKWLFTNISGAYVNYSGPTSGETISYFFSGDTLKKITSIANIPSPLLDTITTVVTSEIWMFNENGTYSINEIYTQFSNPTVNYTSKGEWDYLSNTQPNNCIGLDGACTSIVNPTLLGNSNGGQFVIQSINANTLILAINNNQSSNLGLVDSMNFIITFKRQ